MGVFIAFDVTGLLAACFTYVGRSFEVSEQCESNSVAFPDSLETHICGRTAMLADNAVQRNATKRCLKSLPSQPQSKYEETKPRTKEGYEGVTATLSSTSMAAASSNKELKGLEWVQESFLCGVHEFSA